MRLGLGNMGVGDGNTGHVDYAIKALEELICTTEGNIKLQFGSF
jgi:hypothetical protein